MAHGNGGRFTPCKTDEAAEAIKDQLLVKAKELHALAQTIPGAQVMIMGGAGTKDKLCSFQIGYTTSQNKLMMIANLINQLDPMEQVMFMRIMAEGKGDVEDHSHEV